MRVMSGFGMVLGGVVTALAMAAGPVQAMDAKIYPYHARANYCPAGLQPIQIDGVICCGTPNQSISYQQAKAHPVARKQAQRSSRKLICPVGEKGCFYQ